MDKAAHDTTDTATGTTVTSIPQLRTVYDAPKQLVLDKEQDHLDPHAHHFLEQSRLAVLHLRDVDGQVIPLMAGGPAGFVTVTHPRHLTLTVRAGSWPAARPQRDGDAREGHTVARNAQWSCGALFIVPGVKETLRLSGTAYLARTVRDDASNADPAGSVTVHLDLRKNFFHCAKAFIRSHAWKVA